MSKLFKKIKILLLLIAGFVILAHLFVPHDHHYDFSSNVEHHHHDNSSENEPFHCHFFNNIELSKVRTNSFVNKIKYLPILYTLTFPDLLDIDINNEFSNNIVTNDNPPNYRIIICISPTRGSPLV
jgi:hypothetical protein